MKEVTYKNRFTNITFYEDGTFNGTIHGKDIEIKYNNKGYIIIPIRYCHGRIHRIIWQLFHPEHKLLPNEDIHHVNGIKTDNSLNNLQLVEHNEHAKISANDRIDDLIGSQWYTNGIVEIRSKVPIENFELGRIIKNRKFKRHTNISKKNTLFWYNDGIKRGRFNSDVEAIANGYIYKGRILKQNKIEQNDITFI